MATQSLTLNIPKPELGKGESWLVRILDDNVARSNRVWLEVEDAEGIMVHSTTLDIQLEFAASVQSPQS